jgi:hypothetical protein
VLAHERACVSASGKELERLTHATVARRGILSDSAPRNGPSRVFQNARQLKVVIVGLPAVIALFFNRRS